MAKSIIIAGPRSSGKSWLARSITDFFSPEEVLRLSQGRSTDFNEKIEPNGTMKVVVVGDSTSVMDIYGQEESIRNAFKDSPVFVAAIFTTQDVQGIADNYLACSTDFQVFILPEYTRP